jgi:glutamyl/glutaminyl-tRNA synthetase
MKDQLKYKLTRYAPTPSGYLHIGNALSFVITATIASRSGAQILLRIDDLDRERVRDEYLQDIFDTLYFLGLPYHQGPRNVPEFKTSWSQAQRMHLYNEALEQLKNDDKVFACTCTRSQLQQAGAGYPDTCLDKHLPLEADDTSWRLKTQASIGIKIKSWPDKLLSEKLPAKMQSFVVRKKDGSPSYQLASMIDDLHYGVDLVVRGEDLWASTLAQSYLAHQLQKHAFEQVTFYHHPLVTGADGLKLSKSAGDTSIRFLREQGYDRADVYTLIGSVLGFNEPMGSWQQLGERVMSLLGE